MAILYLLLYIAAALCFITAAISRPTGKINAVALGLFLWILVPLIQSVRTF